MAVVCSSNNSGLFNSKSVRKYEFNYCNNGSKEFSTLIGRKLCKKKRLLILYIQHEYKHEVIDILIVTVIIYETIACK